MARKKKKSKRSNKSNDMVCDQPEILDLDSILRNRGAKEKTKISKSLKKKLAREQLHSAKDDHKRKKASYWHKISVESSSNIERKFLLESFANYVDTEFVPLGYHSGTNNATFYLENNPEAARSIGALNKRIQGNNGETLKIKVSPLSAPDVIPNAHQLITMKEAIAKRYNPVDCILDLSSFHKEPILLEKDILVPLSSYVIMKSVARIVKENIDNLKTLNLCNNNLDSENLKFLSDFSTTLRSLSALNLEKNNITHFTFLTYIKAFPLVELNLDSNPFLKNVKKTQSYINTILKTFPNIKFLDRQNISNFENTLKTDNYPLKSPLQTADQAGSSSHNISEESLKCFLEQYFLLFDTPQRSNLLQAYIPEAKISLESMHPQIANSSFEGVEGLNLFLSSFPETKHIHSSFNLNIAKVTSSEGCVEVNGSCYFNGIENPLNFVRRMVVVPYKAGLCCSLDQIGIK